MNLRNTPLILLLIIQLIYSSSLFSQDQKKTLEITKTEIAPKIDGNLNDKAWKNASIAKEFVQFVPYNGKAATELTEVKIVYDDDAIYIGAIMFDTSPDSIFTTLTKRDGGFDVDADVFMFQVSTFNDGINALLFMLTAAGVQSDIRVSAGDDDPNWDAVWESAVNITDKGWIAEMKIPYSALRFSDDDYQVWGLNFVRGLIRKQEWSSWNRVNNEIDGFINQMGEMNGPEGIKPPLRLSFTPYFSTFAQHSSEDNAWSKGIRGGLDLKYGINESFTLDMMLIPDFSQVQSDDIILNLSAFEIQYEERRPFFTEGTELFEKGDIFYSKRIGSFPKGIWDVEDDLDENEELIENPVKTKIINATKITGRTKKGLGIGFFNAMTLKSEATIRDTLSDAERIYVTQPFTNYNILVFDQNLKNNSYVSLINTNFYIPDDRYTANVTAGEFLLKNKKQNYQFNGTVGLSQIFEEQAAVDLGYKYELNFAKTGGNIRYGLEQELVDEKFNPNDMGFLRYNNYVETQADVSYQILQPYKNLLEWKIRFDTEYQNQYSTGNFIRWQIGMNMNATYKNQWGLGFFADAFPFGTDDYYEARKDGQVYKKASAAYAGLHMGSDRRKKLSFGLFTMFWKSTSEYDESVFRFEIAPTLRVNDKLRFTLELAPSLLNNDIGYVDEISDTIIFGRRDRKTIANTLITDFTFNDKMSISLRGRHYWSSAAYKQFYTLNTDGSLTENDQYNENQDINFNAFNVDMVFTWRFAPGSDLLIVWKNAVYDEGIVVLNDYFENLENTFKASQTNLFSIKVLYYLDYLYLKKKKK